MGQVAVHWLSCQLHFWGSFPVSIALYFESQYAGDLGRSPLFHLFKSATTYCSNELVLKWLPFIQSALNFKEAFLIAYPRVNWIYIWESWVLILVALPWASFLGISILWWWSRLLKTLKCVMNDKRARHNSRCSTSHRISLTTQKFYNCSYRQHHL